MTGGAGIRDTHGHGQHEDPPVDRVARADEALAMLGRTGADIAAIRPHVEEARRALSAGDPGGARHAIRRAEVEIERIQVRQVAAILRRVDVMAADVRSRGADPGDVNGVAEHARRLVLSRLPDRALALAMQVLDDVTARAGARGPTGGGS